MANTYKNIVITPSIGNNSVDPKVQFSGGNTTANTDINLFVYPTSNGTLSFEGTAGQLFSITNDLSNLIFSVADVSGIPSIEAYANGLVTVARISGNVGIGNSTPSHKLSVNGAVSFGNSTIVGFVNATTTLAAGNTTITGFANVSGNGQFTGNVGIGIAPSSAAGLYILKSWNSDAVLYGQLNNIADANTSMTSARAKYGSFTQLVNQNQNKSSDGLTTYNSNYFASFNYAYNGSASTGGDAFASALWGSTNRVYQYANGVNANTVTDARGTISEVYQLGSGVIGTAFGTVSQVIAGNSSVTGNITTAYGSYSSIVSNTASTIGTGYLYYGIHLGATTTTKWGIYLTGETQNYLSGNVGIGNTAPAHKLRVTGTTSLAGAVSDITTLAAGNTTITGFLNVSSTGQFGGAVSGITTLAAGNTTVTGFINVTSTGQFGGAVSGITTLAAGNTTITGFVDASSSGRFTGEIVVKGGGAAAEGGQLVLGYGNNLASAITGQTNHTYNIDVIGGNTGSTPILRLFTNNGDATVTAILNAANTGRVHVGSLAEQTDSTFKVTGTVNVTSTGQFGGNVVISGANNTVNAVFRVVNSTANVFFVAASGNVGIGNTAPLTPLSIQKPAGASAEGEIFGSDGTNWWRLNSRISAGSYSPVAQASDVALIFSGGTIDTGTLTVAQWSNSSRGFRIGSTGVSTFSSIAETVFTITDGAAVDINPANGNIQLWTLGANRTPTASSFAAGQSVTLMILDGTAFSVTWSTIAVTWVGGSAPTLDATRYTVIELWKVGSTVYGAFVGYA